MIEISNQVVSMITFCGFQSLNDNIKLSDSAEFVVEQWKNKLSSHLI